MAAVGRVAGVTNGDIAGVCGVAAGGIAAVCGLTFERPPTQVVTDGCSSGWNLTGWGASAQYGGAPVSSPAKYLWCSALYNASQFNACASKLLIPAGTWSRVVLTATAYFGRFNPQGGEGFGFQWNGRKVLINRAYGATYAVLPGNVAIPNDTWQTVELGLDVASGLAWGRRGAAYGETTEAMDFIYAGGASPMRAAWGNGYVGGLADTGYAASTAATAGWSAVSISLWN